MNRARVLIGVTGGIAAYKVPLLVRLLRKNGCEVKTVLTAAAKPLVGEGALRTLSGNPVYLDACENSESLYDMDHIRLADWADVFVICPATANTISKIACGIADNLLTTLALSIPEEKIIIAPAMNCVMWANRAVQANINILRDRGVDVLPVEDGELACGVSGPGRMIEIDQIAQHILSHTDNACRGDRPRSPAPATVGAQIIPQTLINKKIIISSGPTEEPIDPVRVITNRSSGKMGAALVETALAMGADVTVVTGPASEPLPAGAKIIHVRTAAEMEREMKSRFGEADVCVMAAAVSDYRPVNPSNVKIRKSADSQNITLELTPNPDILAALGASKSTQFLVGFALESEDNTTSAEAKMRRKNCDMMVYNKVYTALGGDNTEITLLTGNGKKENFPVMDKSAAAKAIFTNIARRLDSHGK